MNDAFGTAHRAHASTVGITKFVQKSAAGLLMEKELEYLGKVLQHPETPFIAILGGAKVSDKIGVIRNLLDKVDALIIGGGMAYTFLKAQGEQVGKSLVEEDKVELARQLLQEAKNHKVKFLLPVDHVVADKIDANAIVQTVASGQIPANLMALDIGPKTIETLHRRDRPRPRRSSGTARWASSKCRRSPRARSRSPMRSPTMWAQLRSSAAEIQFRRCTRPAWPTRLRTSPPAAELRWNFSKARSCPA